MKTDKTADELALTVKQCGPKSEPTISYTSFITADSPPFLATAYGCGVTSDYKYCSGLHKKVRSAERCVCLQNITNSRRIYHFLLKRTQNVDLTILGYRQTIAVTVGQVLILENKQHSLCLLAHRLNIMS